ncbi:hypothetical protein H0V99_02690 [Candidatus Saccharibacteria bacterium]|nr:hypothetical protein [Candidatus Saccharibacteria bacterium]
MKTELLIAVIGAGLAILGLITFIARRPRKDLNRKYYQKKWRELQKLCARSETWPMAIILADSLLDEALKKRRFKGKTMGERMVAAQRAMTGNDAMWFAHKMRNKLVHEVDTKLSEKDVKNALIGIRQALRDLGAL